MTREIHIRPVMNGFVVTVGCKTVVFTDPAFLAAELLRYYKSPEETEKVYLASAINKDDGPCVEQQAPRPATESGQGPGIAQQLRTQDPQERRR